MICLALGNSHRWRLASRFETAGGQIRVRGLASGYLVEDKIQYLLLQHSQTNPNS